MRKIVRENLNELVDTREKYRVIDTKTGELIDSGLIKRIAQKLAAKKKEWTATIDNTNESGSSFYDNQPFGNNPGQDRVDRENAAKASVFDTEEFWADVAEGMNGKLVDFELDENRETREITVNVNGIDIFITHNWRIDGSPTKPVTFIETDEIDKISLGRYSIWNDPYKIADDYLEIFYEEDMIS